MKARVDKDSCIGCGLCASTCPQVFKMEDDGLAVAYVDIISEGDKDMAVEAKESCPTEAIHIE